MNNILAPRALLCRVSPAFDGVATLPRISDWAALRENLAAQPLVRDLEPGAFYQLELGRRYASQLAALGLEPLGVGARLELAADGFSVELELRAKGRSVCDRWDVEVDANGLLREMRSEHRTGEGAYDADAFSRFFDALITGL